jgi:hypothetical protein
MCRALLFADLAGVLKTSQPRVDALDHGDLGEDMVEALRRTAVLAVAAMKVRIACARHATRRVPEGFLKSS